jgi:hypothetical protein
VPIAFLSLHSIACFNKDGGNHEKDPRQDSWQCLGKDKHVYGPLEFDLFWSILRVYDLTKRTSDKASVTTEQFEEKGYSGLTRPMCRSRSK